jgi:hypothetical protein
VAHVSTQVEHGPSEGKLAGRGLSTRELQNVVRNVVGSKIRAEFSEFQCSHNPLILFGSPGRIRTSDQPVNSRLLYR